MAADPQKQAVYTMERRELGGHYRHTVKLKPLRRTVRRLCRLYDVPPLRVSVRRERGCDAIYYHLDGYVLLDPKVGRNYATVAHELAHHIAWHRHGHRAQDHGPTWVRYFAQVLHSMRLVPLAGMRAVCRKHKIRMA